MFPKHHTKCLTALNSSREPGIACSMLISPMFHHNAAIFHPYCHDDVIKWKHCPRYWPFVRGICRSPVNSPKGQWRGALMFSLICAWTNGWVNNRDAGGLRRNRAQYDVTARQTDNMRCLILGIVPHSRICLIWKYIKLALFGTWFIHYNNVTWASRLFRSPINLLFIQYHVRSSNNETQNKIFPYHCSIIALPCESTIQTLWKYILITSSLMKWRYMYMISTYWSRVTHICVSKLTSFGSDNGLSPGRRQAIIWINATILLIGPLGTNFNEILIEIHKFALKKVPLKISSGKWRPTMHMVYWKIFAELKSEMWLPHLLSMVYLSIRHALIITCHIIACGM